jgi:hypothetical protein
MTVPDTAYLQTRISQLGIDEKQLEFNRHWIQAMDEKTEDGKIITKEVAQEKTYRLLDADQDGNILIRYFNLNGQPYRWHKEGTKQAIDFIRKRLKEPKGNMKYFQDAGSPQFPYFPPGIIAKYQSAKYHSEEGKISEGKIHTLFLVEGELKALKGELCDIDIIGIPSIHGFYNGDIKGKLHEDIEELIVTCGVEKIIFLVDADLLSVKWEADKDLAKRPESFYGSIKAFRESLQQLIDNDTISLQLVYFMHLKSKFMNEAKGLDDLLCKYQDKTIEIVEDLYKLAFARSYFDGWQINDINKDIIGRLRKELGLADEQEFYRTYSDFIGGREFKFKRRRYIYDSEKKEVVFVKHEDADKFMRIGPDWVKVVTKANKYGDLLEEIIPWKISEITRDYKKFPDFLDQVQKYDDFCNEPCFNGDYKRVHQSNFNLCAPIVWEPAKGSIAASVSFLKHIFQGQGTINLNDQGIPESEDLIVGDQFSIALDYLSLLLQKPKHMLPVPILVSKENGTGKSTFLKWLQTIFGSNMSILGNEQFKMKFNAHYITKFIIAIDEGFLEVDKKAEKERLKQLVTADSAFVEFKGMNVKSINYYGKLIICSNDADRVMKIDEGESRWFVVKVPVVPEDMKDPDLELKLKNEVNAFIHYLSHRQIFHPRKDRLWFKPEWFLTEQFKLIVNETKNRIDRLFEDWIREQFILYNVPTLEYTLKYLTEIMNDARVSKYKIDSLDIKTYLKTKNMKPLDKVKWFKVPVGFAGGQNVDSKTGLIIDNAKDIPELSMKPEDINYQALNGRPYTFLRADWIDVSESEKSESEKIVTIVTDGQKVETSKSDQNSDLPF